jgi:hypothetical protein
MRFLKERYDISATLDDYFVTKADAPHCGQAQRARASSLNTACLHLNIYSTKFGRDPEFRCDS